MSSERLGVFWDGELTGHITKHKKGSLVFQYDSTWLSSHAKPISLSLPCCEAAFSAGTSTTFFENLLPEGAQYKALCLKSRLEYGDTYGFLEKYGKECAGALVICREDEVDSASCAAAYRDITQELETVLADIDPSAQIGLIARTGARLSIAGAQDKLPVLWKDGKVFIPAESSFAPTNAILKPGSGIFADLHKNELLCMHLAKSVGLNVPEATLLTLGDKLAYIVNRYDRQDMPDGTVRRLHQEDFCQALGVRPEDKYQETKGPGFSQCAQLLMRPEIEDSSEARAAIVDCTLFNYLIGNCDAHGKNFSLIHSQKYSTSLAPFYDLVSTMAYPDLEISMAMSIGKTWRHDRIDQKSWNAFAADMFVAKKEIYARMARMHDSMAGVLDAVLEAQAALWGACEVHDRIRNFVLFSLKEFDKLLNTRSA